MKLNKLLHLPLYGLLVVPLNSKEWSHIKFNGIKENQIKQDNTSIQIKVDKSSSLMIYPFNAKKLITSFRIGGKVLGQLNFPFSKNQGLKSTDDFTLKFGFIVSGNEKMTSFKKVFAPKWLIDIYKLFPEDTGFKNLELFEAVQNKQQKGTSRKHPSNDLIQEHFVFTISEEGVFSFVHKLPRTLEVLGLWLSADGDNSESRFTTEIYQIELMQE